MKYTIKMHPNTSENSPRLVIIGDIAFDTKKQAEKQTTDIGGGAYGSLIGALLFRNFIGLISRVGYDFPQEQLALAGIDCQGLTISEEKPTPHFQLTLHPDGQREVQAVVELDQNANLDSFPSLYGQSQIFHLSTSHPEKQLQWITFLRENAPHALISVDAFEIYAERYPLQTLEAMRRSDIIFLNENELAALGAPNVMDQKKQILLKRGDHGATYLHGETEISCAAPKVEVVDTTGAGDVFAGALLAQLANNTSIEIALRLSILAASFSVTQSGLKHLTDVLRQPRMISV